MNTRCLVSLTLFGLVGSIALPPAQGASSPGALVRFTSMLQSETVPESPDGLGLGVGVNSSVPDTTGAVGDHDIMTAANFTLRICDKLGSNVTTTNLNNWWNGLRAGATTPAVSSFDPVITFDPYDHRWIVGSSAFAAPGVASRFLLAVSRNNDPRGKWFYYEFSTADAAWDYSPGVWFDQPTIGFNRNYIGISITTFVPTDSGNTQIFDSVIVVDRLSASTSSLHYWLLRGSLGARSSDVAYPWWFRTCVCRGYDSSEDKLYLISHGNPKTATYGLSSIEPGPKSGTLSVKANYAYPAASSYGHSMLILSGSNGNMVPQAGLADRINPGDERINTAVYRNGSIWAAHTAFLGTYPFPSGHTEIQWLEIRPTGAIRQVGRIYSSLSWLFAPAIAVDASGDVIVGYSQGNADTDLSAGYSYRAGSDALGTMRTGTIYQPGAGPHTAYDPSGRNRSGDYSAAAVDPVDDLTLWVAQEFAASGNRWGIQWAAVQPPGLAPEFISSSLVLYGTVARPFTNFLSTVPISTKFTMIGTPPPGLALEDPASGRISGVPTAYGDWTVAVTARNDVGSSTAVLTFHISSSDVAEAIDVSRDVTTSTPYSWFLETSDTHDGVDAARSGPTPDHRSSWMETTVTSPAEISFWWKVSSEYWDRLFLLVDSVAYTNISREVPWTQVTLTIPGTNSHTLRWEYRKDPTDAEGQDAGWVDQVVINDRTPWFFPGYLADLAFVIDTPVRYVSPLPDPDPGSVYEVLGQVPQGLILDPQTGTFSGSVHTPGTYSFNVRKVSPLGSGVVPVTLTISGIPFDSALNDLGATYNSGGDAPWTTSDNAGASHDGVAAARSAALPAGQQSWLERGLNGPALLSFWWSVSGDLNDQLSVLVDGQQRAALSGKTGWSPKLLDIPAGSHTVRWLFSKGAPSNLGEPEEEQGPDANPPHDTGDGLAWLDEIALLQPAPPVLPQLTQFRLVAGLQVSRQLQASNDPASFSLVGQLPAGLAFDQASGTLSGAPQLAGVFQLSVTASNSAGIGSGTLIIAVDDSGLGAAIGRQDIVPDTSANAPWQVDPLTLWTGYPAARSGQIGDGGLSWMELPFDGPARVSFYWNVSSQTNADFLRLLVDGTEVDHISGETSWLLKDFILPPGSHTLHWQYDKDNSASAGQDAGWVAGLSGQMLSPPEFVGPRAWHGQVGQPFSVMLQAANADVILVGGQLPPSFQFDPQSRILSGTPAAEGSIPFTLQALNVAGGVNRVATLYVNSLPLEQGVDYVGPWQNDAAAPWFVQSDITHDGISAAQSGPIGDNASTSLRHSFDGPGTFSCWMAVSSQRKADYFRLFLDGNVRAELAGDQSWTQVTLAIPAGTHLLEWRYEKDASGEEGLDSAWLDQVTYTPAPPVPTVTLPSAATGIVATAFTLVPTASAAVDTWAADGLPLGVGIDPDSGQLHGAPLDSGEFLATIKATNTRGTGSAQIAITVLTPFQTWATAQGLAGPTAAPGADPDKDQIPNIVEYALGLQPNQPDSASLDVHPDPANGLVRLGFIRDASALGCTIQVETTVDLSNWMPVAKGGNGYDVAPLAPGVSVTEQPISGSLRRVLVTMPQPPNPMFFLRVRVGYSP